MPYLLLKILIENNCLHAFINNFNIINIPYITQEIWKEPGRLLACAFIWNHTPEGHDYWENIYCEIINRNEQW